MFAKNDPWSTDVLSIKLFVRVEGKDGKTLSAAIVLNTYQKSKIVISW